MAEIKNFHEIETHPANTFLIQNTSGEFLLTFALMLPDPPPVGPTPGPQALRSSSIRALVRVALAPQRLAELRGLIDAQLRSYQERQLN